MNKAELIDAMAEKAGLTKVQTRAALEAFMETVGETLKEGDRISLVGFGTFSVARRAERKGRNPQTKKEIIIPAKNVVKFKAGSDLSGHVK
ncbi:MAG: HU family DNA-binding protein [Bacteroidales bacterium]|jgi:DNA-binding protein HU-beta|nr:HU family DNA-binding protein [Bacteroidales bacterium]